MLHKLRARFLENNNVVVLVRGACVIQTGIATQIPWPFSHNGLAYSEAAKGGNSLQK
jgi:hypothetical protein